MTMKQEDILENLLALNETSEELIMERENIETIREDLDVIVNAMEEHINNIDNVIDDLRSLLDEEHLEKLDNALKGIDYE